MAKKAKENIEPVNKEEALQILLNSLKKEYGEGALITGNSTFPEIGRISSGSLALDKALSGGYARGRLIEIVGAESSGKSSLGYSAIRECQKQGELAALIDLEMSFDASYLGSDGIGVDLDRLYLSQPENGEMAIGIIDKLVRSGTMGLIVVDSVAGLVPKAEIEKGTSGAIMGNAAALMSKAMRLITGPANKNNTTIIWINQWRMKIGVMFGDPRTSTSGEALKYFSSQRLDVRRIEVLEKNEDKYGIRSQVKVIKSKVGAPFKTAQFNIIFGKGIDQEMEVIELALEKKIIDRSGAWFAYKEHKIQGLDNLRDLLVKDRNLFNELRELLKQNM